MKVSVDGLRRNLARAYSNLVEAYRELDGEDSIRLTRDGLDEMRGMIAAFMCMYSDEPDDLMSNMTDEIDKLPWADPYDDEKE